MRQTEKGRIRCGTQAAQRQIGPESIASGGCAEALRKIDLVAVARLQIILHRSKSTGVAVRCKIGCDLSLHPESVLRKLWIVLQAVQYLRQQFRGFGKSPVRHQTRGLLLM